MWPPPSRAGRDPVRPLDAPVDGPEVPVDLPRLVSLQLNALQDPVEDPFLAPLVEPVVDRLPGTEAVLREVPPGCSRLQSPQDPVDDPAVRPARPAGPRHARQYLLYPLPLRLPQLVAFHTWLPEAPNVLWGAQVSPRHGAARTLGLQRFRAGAKLVLPWNLVHPRPSGAHGHDQASGAQA